MTDTAPPARPAAEPAAPSAAASEAPPAPQKQVIAPSPGESITTTTTGNTYTMGEKIGEGNFGIVFNTFYLITERCFCPLINLFSLPKFEGLVWLMPLARCLLQAVHYIHVNQYAHQDIHLGNVFTAFAKDELQPNEPGAIQFKLGDLGVTKLFGEINAQNTRAQWMLPPEVLDPAEYGPLDHRIDLYHVGLLLLQLASSKVMQFSRDEILAGRPRDLALALPPPHSFALEKALRRHVVYRTANAMELWRDLHSPAQPALPASTQAPDGGGSSPAA